MLERTIAYVLAALGTMVAAGASVGCILFFIYEPEMPHSLIQK